MAKCVSCSQAVTKRYGGLGKATLCGGCLKVKEVMEAPARTDLGVELDLLVGMALQVGEIREKCKRGRIPWAAFYREYAKLKGCKLKFLHEVVYAHRGSEADDGGDVDQARLD